MGPEAYNTPTPSLPWFRRLPPAGITAAAIYLALSGALLLPVLGCPFDCYVDLEAIHPGQGSFSLNDTRLNTWILAWVQHALFTQPLELFHANAFYPAPNSLAGSEHLIGLALLTLPARLLTDDAILIHQLAVVLSYWLLAVTSHALARWMTGSTGIALVSGALALYMPWRTAELSHIQLLGAHWFPLVWLFALRILLRQEGPRDAFWLSVILALQLLTSFYLAYQVSLLLALTTLTVVLVARVGPRPVGRLALAVSAPYALFGLSALPYLGRESRGELYASLDPEIPTGLGELGHSVLLLAPRFDTLWQRHAGIDPSYFVPATIALLALAALVFALLRRPRPEGERRLQLAVVSLWACVLGAFVMSLGTQVGWGDTAVPLPGYLAAKLIPRTPTSSLGTASRP
jgi:hypothetical protein